MIIYNCHTHTFTIDHVPRKFIPPFISWLVRFKGVRKFARNILPGDRDLLDRYINFVEVTMAGSQKAVFEKLKAYYPNGSTDQTKFIVLPMDMAFMLADKVPVSLDQQHQELSQIAASDNSCIPFIGVDARRDGITEMVKKWHTEHHFKGIKLYPPLGYYPNDTRLAPIYEYAVDNELPIMVHCSRGGVSIKKVTKAMMKEPNPIGRPVIKKKAKHFSDIYTDPANYDPLATQFPNLKICLAHFGGNGEWDKYLEHPWHPGDPASSKSWLSVILELIHKHDNIYTDISSTLFEGDHYMDLLLVLLENEKIRERVLFGSDYYMMERVKSREREMAIKIRSRLGPALFKQIGETNPKRYLGLD